MYGASSRCGCTGSECLGVGLVDELVDGLEEQQEERPNQELGLSANHTANGAGVY